MKKLSYIIFSASLTGITVAALQKPIPAEKLTARTVATASIATTENGTSADFAAEEAKKNVYTAPAAPSGIIESTNATNAGLSSDYTADINKKFVATPKVVSEGWEELPQIAFWSKVMVSPGSKSYASVARTRQVLEELPSSKYNSMSTAQKATYKANLRKQYGLNKNETIYVTSGRNNFYDIESVRKHLPTAIKAFKKEGTDPWFAQAIMLIESPNKLQSSPVGARGAFQLMPSVAKAHGLTVTKHRDDRDDLYKCATGAARLLKKEAIPYTKGLLRKQGIEFKETDTWFKLMVLHVYHAGAGNVGAALAKTGAKEGGMQLIEKMWKTEVKGFKNASQNYSQVALAAMLNFHEVIVEDYAG